VIGTFVPDNLGRPEDVAAALVFQAGQNAQIAPRATLIGGVRDADIATVYPRDAGTIDVGAALGVEQPPVLLLPVPDHHRV